MKVGLIQYSPVWEDKESNKETLNRIIEDNCTDEDLLIFPEMALTGFTMKSEQFSEEIDGDSILYFMEMAKRTNKHIITGLIERTNNQIFNTLFHFDNNGLIIARYRKIHLFSMSGESENYSPGNETVISKIGNIKLGLSICYDLRFPELYRKYTKEKVDVLINIASWPDKRSEHWVSLLKARAIENQCFIIGVNRVGSDPKLNYNGCSCVFDPMGNELALVKNDEKLISLELNLEQVIKTRESLPFLEDMKMI